MPHSYNFKDLTGASIGRWTVLHIVAGVSPTRWLCRCQCGTIKAVPRAGLMAGSSNSCGCLRKERMARIATIHGHTKGVGRGGPVSRTYSTWQSMLFRCEKNYGPRYASYGGRGISVCERWHVFANFLADMGVKPPGVTLERIDNNGNYEPSNCRWATQSEQAFNKRNNRRLELNGRSLTITQWARKLGGGDAMFINHRLRHGWTLEKALTTPSRIHKSRKGAGA